MYAVKHGKLEMLRGKALFTYAFRMLTSVTPIRKDPEQGPPKSNSLT